MTKRTHSFKPNSSLQKMHQTIKWIEIPLKTISLHSLSKSQNLSIQLKEYSLRFVDGELTPDAYRIIELFHPIYVISLGRGKFECLAGLRTLMIGKLVMKPDDVVTVGVLPMMSSEEKDRFHYADLLLTPLVQSLRSPPDTLVRILSEEFIGNKSASEWLPNIANSDANIASLLGTSRSTIARAVRKTRVTCKSHG